MTSLAQQHVFLSASFPSGERGQQFAPFDPGGIADAVTAVVRAVLAEDGKLLFGGHPTITPLVLLVASELGSKDHVDVFQSRWFADEITDETNALVHEGYGTIHWTPKLRTRGESLLNMREAMLRSGFTVLAGIFVGGMEGIVDEYDQFRELQPSVPRVALAGPGGAAATLFAARGRGDLDEQVVSRRYPFVAATLVNRIAAGRQEGGR